MTSSVHRKECPPSARKGGLGNDVSRRWESRDLRVEHAHAFLRETEIQRECVCSAPLYLRYARTKWSMSECQRHWWHKADTVSTEYKHPEESPFIRHAHNVVSDTQYLAGCDSKTGESGGGR